MIDWLSTQTWVVALFILTYLFIVIFYHHKTYIIMGSVFLLLLFGIVGPIEAFSAVHWNVMGIYVGMLFISEIFIYSRAPDLLASKIVAKSSHIWVAMLGVCFLSGIISIVVENVAVVLIVAPIAFLIAHQLNIHPAPLIIGIAISSNLQGVGTMIGDPPSLLLAAEAGLNFNDFFFFQGKPALFFAVQIAAIASLAVLYFFYKKYNAPVKNIKIPPVRSMIPGFTLVGMVVALALVSLWEYHGDSSWLSFLSYYKIGLVCFLSGLFIWIWYYFQEPKDFIPLFKRLDWDTGFFLIGVFIMVQSLINVDFMTSFAEVLAGVVGSNSFLAYNLIVWISVLFSGFVDNVPFIAAMLPVVGTLAELMGVSPYLFYFGLVIGASVGGNITPVGAAANIVGMGMLKKKGYKVSFFDFVKIGLPFTIVSVIASTAFIWILFS